MRSARSATILHERSHDAEVHDESNSSDPRLSHAAYLTAAQLLRGIVRLLFVLVTARALGPEMFGVYALLLAAVEMMAVASGSGYTDYLTREAARDAQMGWGLAAQLIAVRLTCTVPLVVIGLGVLRLLHYSEFVIVTAAWFSITLVLRAVSEAVQGVLRGTEHYIGFFFVELAFGLGLGSGMLLLLVDRGGLSIAIAAELAATAFACVLAIGFSLKFRTPQRSHLPLRKLLKTGAVFNIYAFVGNLYDRLDVVLLSRLAGNVATGIYSAAYRPLGAVQLLPYGVIYSLLPSFSRGPGEPAGRARLEKAMGLLLCASFLIVLVTIALADPAVRFFYGAAFEESAAAIKILIWAVILRYLNFALNIMILAARHERVIATTYLTCLVVNLLGNIILIPMFSWRAAAVLTIVTEGVLFAQNIFWMWKLSSVLPKPFGWVQNSIIFLGLLAAVMFGARYGLTVISGSLCTVTFLVYLLWSGMVSQFSSAWRISALQP